MLWAMIFTYLWLQRSLISAFFYCTLLVALFVGSNVLSKALSIVPYGFDWTPNWASFMSNSSRAKTWLTYSLTLGIPGVLAIYFTARLLASRQMTQLKALAPYIANFFTSHLLFIYSMFSAHADGRFLWISLASNIVITLSAWHFFAHNIKAPSETAMSGPFSSP